MSRFRVKNYRPNKSISLKVYTLSVTCNGVVYWDSGKGLRKLDSLWQNRIKTMTVCLPNGTMGKLVLTENGLIEESVQPTEKTEEATCGKREKG